jgi:hypothetical protein
MVHIRVIDRVVDSRYAVLRLELRESRHDEADDESSCTPCVTLWFLREQDGWRINRISNDSQMYVDVERSVKEWQRPPLSANEYSAIGSLRTINTSQVTYASAYGNGFATELRHLSGPPNENESNAEQAMLLDSTFYDYPLVKSGYRFEYVQLSINEYQVVARPVEYGKTGKRSFFTDESGVIRYTLPDRPPTAADPALQ